MKSILTKSILFCVFSILCSTVFAQIDPKEPDPVVEPKVTKPIKPQEETIYDVVDEPAEYAKGLSGLQIFMAENLKYPQTAFESGIEGKCYLQFVVSAHGYISNVKVKKGVTGCPECDREAVRMVKTMPKWIPGKINGKAVNSIFVLPVTFKLN